MIPAEPTTSIAASVAAGFGAVLVAWVGVDPQALLWTSVGAVFGMSLAPAAGRTRALLVFAAVVLSGALLARSAAETWFGDTAAARNGIAWLLGAFFHPGFAAVTAGIPDIVGRLVDRIGGPRQ